MSVFGGRLKELREARGWSQKGLSDRSGLSQAVISQWERGQRSPSWENVLLLCAALGVDCLAFVGTPGEAKAGVPVGDDYASERTPAPRPRAMGKRK